VAILNHLSVVDEDGRVEIYRLLTGTWDVRVHDDEVILAIRPMNGGRHILHVLQNNEKAFKLL
jgi:hypothetical protein